jgi:hypothetical protein
VPPGSGRPALRLKVAGHGDGRPPAPFQADDPHVEAWVDSKGDVCAYAYETAGLFCMDWPAVARFCFDRTGEVVTAWPASDQPPSVLDRVHRRAVVPAALQCLGYEVLHASAVRLSTGVAGFCGQPEAGKSTFSYALKARGFDHWSDDSLVLDVGADRVRAVPIPFDAALRPLSARHLAGVLDGPHQGLVTTAPGDAAPLVALVLLARERDAGRIPPSLTPVTKVEAFQRLLAHSCWFSAKDSGRWRAQMANYLALVDFTPVYALRYASGFDALGEVLDVVLGALDASAQTLAGAR